MWECGMIFSSLINKLLLRARKIGKNEINVYSLENSFYAFEAKKMGMRSQLLAGDILQVQNGCQSFNIWHCGTDFDGWGSLKLAGDKSHRYARLRQEGIPIPTHAVLKSGDYHGVMKFRQSINNSPVVIKPARETGDGDGVCIKPEGHLETLFAVFFAGSFGRQIIVEEFREGENYRLLYCRGKFLAASSRNPATVEGDGVHTIRRLIERMNQGRRKVGDIVAYCPETRPILYKVPLTRETARSLAKQRYSLDSIPPRGTIVRLQDICHWLRGGHYRDVSDVISPEIIEMGRRAAHAVGIHLAGVDVIAESITHPFSNRFVINEVNTTPGILIHYEIINPSCRRPVAKKLLESFMYGSDYSAGGGFQS